MNTPDLTPPKKKPSVTVVKETDDGLWVWYTKDNKLVQDGDGNIMNIAATRYDKEAVRALREAAEHYGVAEGGHAQFLEGQRRVTDSEYEQQKARDEAGLIPDPYDIPALKDELRFMETRRKQ